MFSIHNTLSHLRSPIAHILDELKYNSSDINIIQNQWSYIIKQHGDEKSDTISFWIQVYNFKNSVGENTFKELSSFVLLLLDFPFSNAEVKRLFSLMALIKNKIRQK